jgi:hypothetical protein
MKYLYSVFDVNIGLLYMFKHGASSVTDPISNMYRGHNYVYLISHPSVKVIYAHQGVGRYPTKSEVQEFSSDLHKKISMGVYTKFAGDTGPKNVMSTMYTTMLEHDDPNFFLADLR